MHRSTAVPPSVLPPRMAGPEPVGTILPRVLAAVTQQAEARTARRRPFREPEVLQLALPLERPAPADRPRPVAAQVA